MEENKHIYTLHLTEKQAKILSYACDRMARLIEGQDWTYQELMEEAWEKRCKKATGNMMDQTFEGGWQNMRHDAERICKEIKKRFWGLPLNTLNGIGYDDYADILWDCHQVIRHQLWLDKPEGEKSHITVDSDTPMRVGSEPLINIMRNE